MATSVPAIVLSKQFPNPAEPLRGLFVLEQVLATRDEIEWAAVAPVPWVPPGVARLAGKTRVSLSGNVRGIPTVWPRYLALPRRGLYATAGRAMARACRPITGDIFGAHRPAFVHAHELYPSGAAASLLLRDHDVPLILTAHGSDLYTNLDTPSWRLALEEGVRAADRIVCVGSKLRDDLVDEFEIPAERTVVIPDTFDDTLFTFAEREPWHDRPLRLLFVGRLAPEKGIDVLLEGFERVVSGGLEATLRIVGSGPLEGLVRDRLDAQGLGGRVELVGAVGGAELAEEMARADALVSSSLRESFGVVIVEALATGLPVVATRCGGPEETVGADDGVLARPGDAESLAGAVREVASRYGRFDGRRIAERAHGRFGPETVGAELVSLYEEVARTR
jgi:glycosyltransferase involved in cell wall biosynthesis